ncbi:MAG: hypothetical protein K2N56_02835 [Oscillospiraceae bacterium]|nr:hypothetical protein [Oscillospiraceae bacterium]
MKKRIIAFFAAITVALTSTTAYAHTGEYWRGVHLNDKQKDMCIVIRKSAINSLLTEEVYRTGVSFWNNISSNVKVSVEFEENSSPHDLLIYMALQKSMVVGKTTLELEGRVGYTQPYDKNGNPLDGEIGDNSDWWLAQIQMNIDESAYSVASKPALTAKKVYIHEVGHALKLTHPKCNPSLDLHSYGDGYPLSVMNQGIPYSYAEGKGGATSDVPKYHDIINLKAKWGE